MKQLKNENGYTLLSVLLVVVVVIALGMTLLSINLNSFKLVQIAQGNVQAKLDGEMAIEEAMALIENKVESINSSIEQGLVPAAQYLSVLHTALDHIQSVDGKKFTLNYQTLKQDSQNEGMFLDQVTISSAISKQKKIEKTVTISTISEVFRYSAISPGDIFLNGSPYIEGDVYTGNNIYTSNNPLISLLSSTLFPTIDGSLTVEGKYFGDKTDQCFWCGVNWQPFSPDMENLKTFFKVPPKIKDRELNIDPIQIGQIISEKQNEVSQMGNYTRYKKGLSISGNQTLSNNTLINGDLVISSGSTLNIYGKLYVTGSIYINGSHHQNHNTKIIVNGNQNFIYAAGNVSFEDVDLDGVMYIGGSANIQGELNSNGTIYAGNNIFVSSLYNNAGTLILLANNQITLAFNNIFNDAPMEMNAYLYSNQELQIYGILSNLKINGGIYGNPIRLNSVTTNGTPRLSIHYQKDLILDPPKGIPTVEKLTIKEIDMEYKSKQN
ncbi:hypothetical protein [Falsibacillus albus]|uniref:Uncharacterized protein n=1 Tax=Falsibacillus albus TaxID=2478915 RepID=A0A3L7K7A7_9BACI|nr:hypothetical protein [Falsibacillus albus]RLQ98041.1 hypothetical protein D9X91_01240 [Falsibacillus albus]